MLVNNTSQMMPGYINHEGEVVQDITDHHSTVVSHRRTTRQRHLSSGQDENIASNYFAAQYGGQQRQAEVRTWLYSSFYSMWGEECGKDEDLRSVLTVFFKVFFLPLLDRHSDYLFYFLFS